VFLSIFATWVRVECLALFSRTSVVPFPFGSWSPSFPCVSFGMSLETPIEIVLLGPFFVVCQINALYFSLDCHRRKDFMGHVRPRTSGLRSRATPTRNRFALYVEPYGAAASVLPRRERLWTQV